MGSFLDDLFCVMTRCLGNLLHILKAKSFRRALEKGQKPPEKAVEGLREALSTAKDNSVELPGGIMAIATQFTS